MGKISGPFPEDMESFGMLQLKNGLECITKITTIYQYVKLLHDKFIITKHIS